jgi:hypothetical protein
MSRNLRKKPDLTQPGIAHTGEIRIKGYSIISNIFKKRKIYAIHKEKRVLLAYEC